MARDRDHYLSATHLRGFSVDGRRLWQLDKTTRKIALVSARDAAIERRMNTVMREDRADRSLETFMATVNEDKAAPVLQRLRAMEGGRAALASAESDALARYITLTYARSPASRDGNRRRAAEVVRRMARDFEDSSAFAQKMYAQGVRMDAMQLEIFRLRSLVEFRAGRMPKGIAAWPISVDRSLDKPPQLVDAMVKIVIRRQAPPWMLLGDTAVLLIRDEQYWQHGALGFGVSGVRVVVPLSARTFLVCGALHEDEVPAAIERWSSDATAAYANRATIDHSTRFVWAETPEHIETAFVSVEHDILATI